VVLGAQQAARDAFVAGKSKMGSSSIVGRRDKASLDKVAFDYINTHGKDLHGDPLGKYFSTLLGIRSASTSTIPTSTTSPSSLVQCSPSSRASTFREKIGVRIEDTSTSTLTQADDFAEKLAPRRKSRSGHAGK